jgi:hypothetical protein
VGAGGPRPVEVVRRVLRRAGSHGDDDVAAIGAGLDPEMAGKFGPCLPAGLRARVLARRFLDLDGVRRLVARG